MPVADSDGSLEKVAVDCAECRVEEATLVVRTRHLCRCVQSTCSVLQGSNSKLMVRRECFKKYIATKVLKRLETNNIRGGFNDAPKTLLVPVSFGVSSICLLHLLDQQLRGRAEQGRHAGYNLHVLFVDHSTVIDQAFPEELAFLLKHRFPPHTYTTISLIDYKEYNINLDGIMDGEEQSLDRIISFLPSPTSRTDFVDIARRRLILAFAKRHDCDSILFGDSTTRLAERTLIETSKGRGGTLPWLTADGVSTDGMRCVYPMRDLLRKELVAYAGLVLPPLTPLILERLKEFPASSKDISIDILMSQYFESVEQSYPSIVANVVRTSGKLTAASILETGKVCALCDQKIMDQSWGGDQQSTELTQSTEDNQQYGSRMLCYGCTRNVLHP